MTGFDEAGSHALDAGAADDWDDAPAFLAGHGEMARLMRRHDWSATPLGSPRGWNPALRTIVRLLLNTRHPMFVVWGRALTCLYNDACIAWVGPERHTRALGRPGPEVWGRTWGALGPQVEQVMARGGAVWREKHRVPVTRQGRHEDAYWTYSLSPIDRGAEADDGGGVLFVCTETTSQVAAERREAQAIAARATERDGLARLFAQAPSFMALLTGSEHRIELANPAFARLVGDADILGRTLAQVLPDALEQGHVGRLDEALRTGDAVTSRWAKCPVRPATGGEFQERHLDFVYQPVRSSSGDVTGILVQGTDVTERAIAELEVRQLNAALERRVATETAARDKIEEALRQAQKMEAVGQLTGGIAHDFNNILQAAASGIELALRRLASGRTEDAAEFLNAAREAAARAGALTQRLLAFGRRQALDPKPVLLDGLIEGLVGLISRTVGPGITVELQLKDGCWPVRCDPNQLESALLNLAINARDAMPAGNGKLVIETAHVELHEADTEGWGAATPGEYVRIGVSDSGTGMPADVLAHAFEPFFTTKPSGQGTGLGLSQLYGFVRQSQGVVRLESEVGVGTLVNLYLPRSHDAPSDVGTAAAAEPPPQPGRATAVVTVLLVEDEPAVRSFAAETLRERGYTVLEASDGPTGLRTLQDAVRAPEAHGIDLLVTDVGLPGGLNGRQLAEAARELLPDLQILLITGYAGDAIEGQGRLGRDMELLGKPFELEALARRVEDMAARSRGR